MPLPNEATLYQKIKKGSEGGHEFARILIQLLTADAKEKDYNFIVTSDASGDFKGVDAIAEINGKKIGFQFKFYPTSMSGSQKSSITKSFKNATEKFPDIDKWILVTPEDFDFRAMEWFEKNLTDKKVKCQHWGHTYIMDLMLKHKQIGELYYTIQPKTKDVEISLTDAEDYFLQLLESPNAARKLMSNAQPTHSDCQQVFSHNFASYIADVYHTIFRNITDNPEKFPLFDKTRVKISSGTITDIQNFTDDLPGGMRQIFLKDNALRAGIRFFHVKFLGEDKEFGYTLGIWCYLNDRWVFFPKPWRIINTVKDMRNSKLVRRLVLILKIFGLRTYFKNRNQMELGILINLISDKLKE